MTATFTARAQTAASTDRMRGRRAGRRATVLAAAVGLVVAVGAASTIVEGASHHAAAPGDELASSAPVQPPVPWRRADGPSDGPTAPDDGPTVPRLHPRPPADGRDAPDPFVLRDGDRYVLYTTQVGLLNVPVAVSADLAIWSAPSDALPQLPPWAEWGRTWAPGVLQRRSHYVLYFAARARGLGLQCIGVAVGHSAEGPFATTAPAPLVCQPGLGGSIDPYPFVDRDGTAYLLWKSEGNALGRASTLFIQRLRPDGLDVEGTATALLHSGAAWEAPLIENPAIVATGDSYVLLYSGGWWESGTYAIGYASCESASGPCTKVTVRAPALATTGDDVGPGGACVVTGPNGERWIAYHAWSPDAIGYAAGGTRSLRFARLVVHDGQAVLRPSQL